MIKAVVFDLGAVLIDWNPRYVYRDLFPSEDALEHFMTQIITSEWNHQMDLGKPFADCIRELAALHPDYASQINLYRSRWADMLGGPIHESVDILMELKARGVPLYALTNWSAETWPEAVQIFPFLRLFDGRIVSGEVKLAKPDPAIYKLLIDTYQLNPRETLFIDDKRENVQTAWDLGFNAVQFLSPYQLEQDLLGYGLIPNDTSEDDDTQDDHGGCCGGGCGCSHP